jgi:hypothetical protein
MLVKRLEKCASSKRLTQMVITLYLEGPGSNSEMSVLINAFVVLPNPFRKILG